MEKEQQTNEDLIKNFINSKEEFVEAAKILFDTYGNDPKIRSILIKKIPLVSFIDRVYLSATSKRRDDGSVELGDSYIDLVDLAANHQCSEYVLNSIYVLKEEIEHKCWEEMMATLSSSGEDEYYMSNKHFNEALMGSKHIIIRLYIGLAGNPMTPKEILNSIYLNKDFSNIEIDYDRIHNGSYEYLSRDIWRAEAKEAEKEIIEALLSNPNCPKNIREELQSGKITERTSNFEENSNKKNDTLQQEFDALMLAQQRINDEINNGGSGLRF